MPHLIPGQFVMFVLIQTDGRPAIPPPFRWQRARPLGGPVKTSRVKYPRWPKVANESERQQLQALQDRRAIVTMARLGYPDNVIGEVYHRNLHGVYKIRKRDGIKRYRTDHYVRSAA